MNKLNYKLFPFITNLHVTECPAYGITRRNRSAHGDFISDEHL